MGQITVEKNVGGIEGLCVITPAVHGDNRGYFMETYSQRDMEEAGLNIPFVQDNQSMSVKGVLRGLHFQKQYPQTKLDGELAVADALEKYFIVRIAWVFGRNGNNFIKTMLKLSEKYDTLRVVSDQIGTPTYTLDLSRLLVDMVLSDKYGYYHATNEGGFISWYDFACEIFRQAGKHVTVNPVTTAEYGLSKAARPYNSRLDKQKLVENGFEPLPTWQDALSRYLKEIEE